MAWLDLIYRLTLSAGALCGLYGISSALLRDYSLGFSVRFVRRDLS